MTTPSKFTKGITLKWTESLPDYPASTWTLKYVFANPNGKKEITAVADGDDYQITVPFTTTSTFDTGRYDWQAFVDDGGAERYCVGSGTTEVIEDFAVVTGFDGRSQLRQIVDAINAYLLGDATKQQQKVRYADREIWSYDRADLILLRDKLMRELVHEENELRASQGKPNRNKLRSVFL